MDEVARFVELLGEYGILVLLDMHVVEAGKWPDGGTVDANGESQLRAAWEVLAKRLCDPRKYWHVFAAGARHSVAGEAVLAHSAAGIGAWARAWVRVRGRPEDVWVVGA